MTEEHVQLITFSGSDGIKIFRALDVTKIHGHDNISVRIIKLYIKSVAHQLTSIPSGTFATQWKKQILFQSIRRNKQIVSNYRPVSLLPICSKLFEKLIFKKLFKFFEETNLLSKHQSGFRPGD